MKRLLSLLLCIALCFSICLYISIPASAEAGWNGSAATSFAGGGEGTKEDPYRIATAEELKLFSNIVNGIDGQTESIAACAVLTQDIVLNEGNLSAYNGTDATDWIQWSPICFSQTKKYKGTFNGAGHTVSGLFISGSSAYMGLFGSVEKRASILNVGVVNSFVNATISVGGVCAFNDGTIRNCFFEGTIHSQNLMVGGVCGVNTGTVTQCYNAGTVKGCEIVGGVCGMNNGTVINCYNTGSVTKIENESPTYYAGGVCAYSDGTIKNCFNTGTVAGTQNTAAVCGCRNEGTIENSFYLDTCGKTDDCATGKTAEQFASGEVAWLLNGQKDNGEVYFFMDNGRVTLDQTKYIPRLENGIYLPLQKTSTALSYSVDPTYTVTIPTEVVLGEAVSISAENVVLEEGKQLEVSLSAASGENNTFTVTNGASGELAYQVTKGDETIAVGDNILTVNPTEASTGSTVLNFGTPTEEIKYAGSYSGTVTFTASIKKQPVKFRIATDYLSQETDEFSAPNGTTWKQWTESEANTYGLQSFFDEEVRRNFVFVPDSNGEISSDAKVIIPGVEWNGEKWHIMFFDSDDLAKEKEVIIDTTYLLVPIQALSDVVDEMETL